MQTPMRGTEVVRMDKFDSSDADGGRSDGKVERIYEGMGGWKEGVGIIEGEKGHSHLSYERLKNENGAFQKRT